MNKIVAFLALCANIILCAHEQMVDQRVALLKTIQREAENLIWHESDLNPEQLQLLLNFCCASFALVLAEHKLLQEAQFIFPMSWHMRYNNEEPLISSEHLLMLERSLIRFSQLYTTREQLRSAYHTLEKRIDSTENKAISKIVEKMARHSTHLVNYFSHQENTRIQQVINEAHQLLFHCATMLKNTANTYQSLIDETYPLPISTSSNKEITEIETAHGQISSIAKQVYETMEATNLVSNKIKDCQEFGALAFYIYFKATQEGMMERSIDDQYFGMLFENNVLISTDLKTKKLHEPIFDTNIPFFNR